MFGRVAAGDDHALGELYGHLGARSFGLALRIIGDRPLAEEATQEAWLQIWAHAARFDATKGGVVNWVLLITRRKAIEKVRVEERRRANELRGRHDYLEHQGDETLDAVLAKADLVILRGALDALSAHQREAILTAYQADHPNRDRTVCETLGVPLGTAKYRIRQALIHLRLHIAQDAA